MHTMSASNFIVVGVRAAHCMELLLELLLLPVTMTYPIMLRAPFTSSRICTGNPTDVLSSAMAMSVRAWINLRAMSDAHETVAHRTKHLRIVHPAADTRCAGRCARRTMCCAYQSFSMPIVWSRMENMLYASPSISTIISRVDIIV